jgi:cytoskeleton protein RodZ
MAEQIRHTDPDVPRYRAAESSAAARAVAGPLPGGVAARLKYERERHDRSLRDVAAALNIRFVYLQAIEDGEFNKLPGNAYAIGFVRGYAEYLGLDSDDLVARFKAEVAELGKQTELVFPTPVPEGKVPGAALILVSVLCFGLAYGAWSYFSTEDREVADLVPTVPERLQGLLAGEDQAGARVAEASAALSEPVSDIDTGSATSASPDLSAGRDGPAVEAEPPTPVEHAGAETTSSETEAAESTASETEAVEITSLATASFETIPVDSESMTAGSDGAVPEVDGVATPPQETARPAEVAAPAEPPGDLPVVAHNQDAEAAEPAPAGPAPETPPETIATAPEAQAIPAAPSAGDAAAATGPLEAQVYGRGNVGTRIVLRATQDSWVQVRDRNEDLLFTRVLRAGDSYQVPNQSGLTLLTGNAGGLEVEVDGTTLGALGPVGTVRRNVALEPTDLLNGATLTQ